VEVASLELADHLRNEIRPFCGEVLSADNADCIAQLEKIEERKKLS
jgi:hypothetical protein